jgi:ADP-heptose:LPS heptosyltransferase
MMTPKQLEIIKAARARKRAEPEEIILHAHLCPGDTCMATTIPYSLNQQFPGKYRIGVKGSSAEAIFANNPLIRKVSDGAKIIKCEYNDCGFVDVAGVNIIQAMHMHVGRELGIDLKVSFNRPRFHLTPNESSFRLMREPYALINSGWKDDCETKWYARWQEVVDMLLERYPLLKIVQVGESWHHHEPLKNVISMIGHWDAQPRRLIVAAANAAFGLGPISFITHVFAGHGKPFVCVQTGAESLALAGYPNIKYVSRQTTMECCRNGGCCNMKWRECRHMKNGTSNVPECLDIPPQEIVDAVGQFVKGGLVKFEISEMKSPAFVVGTLFDKDMACLGKETSDILAAYSKAKHYDCILGKAFDSPMPVKWHKFRFVSEYLKAHPENGWFLWVDADAVIRNTAFSLDSLLDDVDLIIGDGLPENRVNFGVFLIRNCEASLRFLDNAWSNPEALDLGSLRVKVIPRRTFNSFTGEYQQGDFIQHFAGPNKPKSLKPPIPICTSLGRAVMVDGKPKMYTIPPGY